MTKPKNVNEGLTSIDMLTRCLQEWKRQLKSIPAEFRNRHLWMPRVKDLEIFVQRYHRRLADKTGSDDPGLRQEAAQYLTKIRSQMIVSPSDVERTLIDDHRRLEDTIKAQHNCMDHVRQSMESVIREQVHESKAFSSSNSTMQQAVPTAHMLPDGSQVQQSNPAPMNLAYAAANITSAATGNGHEGQGAPTGPSDRRTTSSGFPEGIQASSQVKRPNQLFPLSANTMNQTSLQFTTPSRADPSTGVSAYNGSNLDTNTLFTPPLRQQRRDEPKSMLTPPASQLRRSPQQNDNSGYRIRRERDRSDDHYRQNSHNGHQHNPAPRTQHLSPHHLSHTRNRSSSPCHEPRRNQRSGIFGNESPIHDDFRTGPRIRGRGHAPNRYDDAQQNSSHGHKSRRFDRKYNGNDHYKPEESPVRRVRR